MVYSLTYKANWLVVSCINTAIVTRHRRDNIGIGLAIPRVICGKSVLEQLSKYGQVERGMLGVTAINITPDY